LTLLETIIVIFCNSFKNRRYNLNFKIRCRSTEILKIKKSTQKWPTITNRISTRQSPVVVTQHPHSEW